MKILIIRFSSIGDIVLTSSVVRCLKKQLPEAEIHYLTKEKFYDILQGNPYISKIHLLRNSLSEIIRELQKEHFDHVVDLHKNIRSFLVRLRLNAPSTSFSKLNFRKWLLVSFKINLLPSLHIVDRYFQAVQKLQVYNDHEGLDYFLSDVYMKSAQALSVAFEGKFCAFVIGGTYFTKRYPKEKVVELIKKVPYPVALLGGKQDIEDGLFIEANSTNSILNLCGKLTLNESAAVVSLSDIVFTNDTGLMHIASAFGKPIVSFWGSNVPEFGMYPYKSKHFIAEVSPLSCRPCSKLGKKKCPKGHFNCMLKIDQEAILKWISK